MAKKQKQDLTEDQDIDDVTVNSDVQNDEVVVSESEGSDTVHPNSRPVNDPKTKVAYLTHMIGAMHTMTKDELATWFQKMNARLNTQSVPDSSASNRATVAMKNTVKEDFLDMFTADDTLTEEFKDKATTLFEAAIEGRVAIEVARLEEEYEESLAEGIEQVVAELTEQLDTYLDYAVGEFVVENEIAIESGLRSDITEGFIEGLKNLFAENYIEVPDDKLDVLDTLATKVDELEEALDAQVTENASLQKQLTEGTRKDAFASVVADLSDVQVEKFKKLAESVEFDGDVEAYTKKLGMVKEGFLQAGVKTAPTKLASLEEQAGFEEQATEGKKVYVDESVSIYAKALDSVSRK